MFEFIVKKDGYDDAVVDWFVLYGAPTVRGSLRDLRPDETVVVRLPGILSGSGYEDARNPVLYPDGSLRLKVGVVMFAPDDKRFEWFHEEFSENTLPFTIVANRP